MDSNNKDEASVFISDAVSYTIIFIQEGLADVIKILEREVLTDIPESVFVPRCKIVWDRTDFTEITGNTTVTAIAIAKNYTVTYDLKILKNDSEAIFRQQHNRLHVIRKPTCKEYYFKAWLIEGTETKF